jgi:TonB family protein
MRPRLRYILTILLAFGTLLYAQDSAQETHSQPSSAPALCDPDTFVPGPALEVLSDTSGVDLRQYLRDVARSIRINWHAAIPADAQPPLKKAGCATIEFAIEKDGKLTGMKLAQSSGDATLERAAWVGVTASSPFPPLPEQFSGESLGLRFHFHYNAAQRGHLMPVGPGSGRWQSASAGDNSGSGGTPEPQTYNGEPVYRVGHGVTAPRGTYMPQPGYTEKARKKKLSGTVVLAMIVTTQGDADDVKVVRGFDPDLDQHAVDTVRQWKFEPGTKDGKPVPVALSVEVSFRLY